MSNWYKLLQEGGKRKGQFDWTLLCCGQPENRRKDPYKSNNTEKEKTASFIQEVQVAEVGNNRLSIWINGKNYEYAGKDGEKIRQTIYTLKELSKNPKNVREAGSLLSMIVQKLHPFLKR